MESGSWAEWLSAVAATGALIAAAWAAMVSRRLFGIESRRDEAASQRERRQQATRLAAWCIGRGSGEDLRHRGLTVRNTSDSPFFDVEITSTYSSSRERDPIPMHPLVLTILPPGDFVVFGSKQYRWTFPVEGSSVVDSFGPITKTAGWSVTNVTFTDSHGVRWSRQGARLVEVHTGSAL